MPSLDDVLSSEPAGGGRYAFTIPPGWEQGRGAFGGLIMGGLVRAITDELADPALVVRTMTAQIPAPVQAGTAAIVVEVLRAGSAVTTATARLVQDGETRVIVVAVCAKPRAGSAAMRWQTERPPSAATWLDVKPLPLMPGVTPVFAQHFEYRLVGPMPFAKGAEARLLGWIGAREAVTRRDAAYVVALADAYWSAGFAVFAAPRPMSTIAFALELIEPITDLEPDAPLLVRGYAPAAQDGYIFETRELWGADGRLVARNHQTFVVVN